MTLYACEYKSSFAAETASGLADALFAAASAGFSLAFLPVWSHPVIPTVTNSMTGKIIDLNFMEYPGI